MTGYPMPALNPLTTPWTEKSVVDVCQQEGRMRLNWGSLAIALCVVIGVLIAPAQPVLGGLSWTGTCSEPGCSRVLQLASTSTAAGFIGPITATIAPVVFGSLPVQGSLSATQTITIPGTLAITVDDMRGNNQGFSVSIRCGEDSLAPCFTSPRAPAGIPASSVSIAGQTLSRGVLFYGDGIGQAIGLDATGHSLDNSSVVGGACPRAIIGQGIYQYDVPLLLTLQYPATDYVTLPVGFTAHFYVTVTEDVSPVGCGDGT